MARLQVVGVGDHRHVIHVVFSRVERGFIVGDVQKAQFTCARVYFKECGIGAGQGISQVAGHGFRGEDHASLIFCKVCRGRCRNAWRHQHLNGHRKFGGWGVDTVTRSDGEVVDVVLASVQGLGHVGRLFEAHRTGGGIDGEKGRVSAVQQPVVEHRARIGVGGYSLVGNAFSEIGKRNVIT